MTNDVEASRLTDLGNEEAYDVLQMTHFIKWKTRQLVATGSALAVLLGGATVCIQQVNHTTQWLQIFQHGRYIGMVPDQKNVSTSMKRIAEGYGVTYHTEPIHTQVNGAYHWKQVSRFPTPGAVIQLNGKPIVYTTSKEAARRVLSYVKETVSAYVHLSAPQATSQFLGHVDVANVTVPVTDILKPVDATRMILHAQPMGQLSGRAASPAAALTHVVLAGAIHPLIPVQSKATMHKTVSLPYPIHYVKDVNLAVGQQKIISHGHPGTKVELLDVSFLNGRQTSAHVVSATTLSQPVPERVDEGTNDGVATGSWVWPTNGYIITSPFGWRSFGGGQFHPGIDIGVPIGSPIYATNNGVVISAGWNNGGYGNWVEIDNGNGIMTVFGHMSHVVARDGETVHKGELIGYSGETGYATGPHLHYEVRLNNVPVNPMKYT